MRTCLGFRSLLSTALLLGLVASAASARGQNALVLRGGTIYPSPGAAPILNASVVMEAGRITAVGSEGGVKIPKGAQTIDCTGKFIVAGFWNSHVHFSFWADSTNIPDAEVEAQLRKMLTQWGFTTVWDLGSTPASTLALRKRIESGATPGPQILMAGPMFPVNGHPDYLPADIQVPEPATTDAAKALTVGYLKMGLDGIKLFTGSYMGREKPVVNMDPSIANAAAAAAREQSKPTFAHTQNRRGTDTALAAGVDVLAHTIPTEPGWSSEELTRMKDQHTALTPTLTLWTTVTPSERAQQFLVNAGVAELKDFFAQGNPVLFGTDAGFQSIFDTTLELQLMGRVMGWQDVLASLTTNPSSFFHQNDKGRVAEGTTADLVVLKQDPAKDVANLAKVEYTIRSGRVLFSSSSPADSH